MLVKLLGLAIVLYGSTVAFMYLVQGMLLFPGSRLPSVPVDVPIRPERLTIAIEDGQLHGMLYRRRSGPGELLIGFGGNAQDAELLGQDLAQRFADLDVAAFHYRGYGPSAGRPSEAALLADALVIHDRLVAMLRPQRTFAFGMSLGSGVAAYLLRQRQLAGAILVTPYDSIEALAKESYPWLPVSWLLRHRFRSLEWLAGNPTPIAIVAAAQDRIIAPARTDALRAGIANLVFDVTIGEAGHNNLEGLPAFDRALHGAMAALRAAAARS